MSRTGISIWGILLSLILITPCSASLIVASGAGSTLATAEDLTGQYPTEIVGTLSGTDMNDVSIFKIFNRQPLDFSAITIGGAFSIPDTVLSLFNSVGAGIYLNDDIGGGTGDTLSCLPSAGIANPCPTVGVGSVLPTGVYYLAISRSSNYPVDSIDNPIFLTGSFTDLLGPASSNALDHWDGGASASSYTDQVNFDILLTGTVPEPATWLLTGGVLALGMLQSRRRRTVR